MGEFVQKKKEFLLYQLHMLWLFTASDMKTIVWPETAFGVFSALSGPCLTTNPIPRFDDILLRLPHIVLWIWLNLLLFNIANQRLPQSILEDQLNGAKSRRPLPLRRLSPLQARQLLLLVVPSVLGITYFLGGFTETVYATVLTWMYNDLGGAHEHYIIRNVINAAGFVSYSAGTLRLAAGIGKHELNPTAKIWLSIIGAIIFSTLQMQDMADQEGDAKTGRKTMPLVHGHIVARWPIAIPVIFWTLVCPTFWELDLIGYLPIGLVGGLLAGRVMLKRTVAADHVTFKIYCFRTIMVYLLPLFKDYGALTRFWDERLSSSFSDMSRWIDFDALTGSSSIWSMNWGIVQRVTLPSAMVVICGLTVAAVMVVIGVIIYRLYFHPLAKYPGPFLAKVTNWYNVYHCYIGDQHLEFARIHNKYGKFVRYGPNRLSICSVTGLKAIYSTRANVQKSSMFNVFPHFFNSHSTLTMIDTTKGLYTQKRRVTAHALNDHSLKFIEDDTLSIIRRFCTSMGSTEATGWSKARNVKMMASHLTFDVMGTVCFGKSFGMMDNTNNHYIVDVVSKGAHALNTVGHMLPILKTGIHNLLFRDLLNGLQRYKEYSEIACMTRISAGTSLTKSDVMGCILRARTTADAPLFTTAELISEASLLITAEVRSTFTALEEIRAGAKLNSCTYLRACIDEALRMSPPVGGLLAREVRSGGMEIDGELVPTGTEVGTPIYAIHCCEEYFPDSYAYMPERWLEGEKEGDEEARSKVMGAFMAFSTGPRGCVGKAMAMQECLTVLGRLVWMLEWRVRAGSTLGEGKVGVRGQRWRRDEYQLWDTFASECDGPEVEFKARDMAMMG